MKKVIVFFIAAITVVNMAFAQAQDLHNNTNFISYINTSNDLCKLIGKSLGNDVSNIASAKTALEALQRNSSLTDDEIFSRIKTIFKLPVTVDVKNYYNQINYDIVNLKNTYGNKFEINFIRKEAGITPTKATEGGGGCSNNTAYAACSAGCFSAAAIGYAGCVGTLLGAPVCWALVALGQTSCIYLCYETYCKGNAN